MSDKKNKTEIVEYKIHKKMIIKNYLKYSHDKGIVVAVLNQQKKDEFTEKEFRDLLKKEMERVIK